MILDNFKKLGIRNKIIVTLFANCLLIFLIFYFVIIPRMNFIKESGKEIIDRRVFSEEQYIKAKKFRENNKGMKLVDEDIQKLDRVFVSHDDDLKFIETLEDVATDNNISQKISLGATQDKEGDDFEKIILNISVEGSFRNMMDYLISLETLDYYININKLEISRFGAIQNKEESSEDVISSSSKVICKITADTYWK